MGSTTAFSWHNTLEGGPVNLDAVYLLLEYNFTVFCHQWRADKQRSSLQIKKHLKENEYKLCKAAHHLVSIWYRKAKWHCDGPCEMSSSLGIQSHVGPRWNFICIIAWPSVNTDPSCRYREEIRGGSMKWSEMTKLVWERSSSGTGELVLGRCWQSCLLLKVQHNAYYTYQEQLVSGSARISIDFLQLLCLLLWFFANLWHVL